MVTVTLKEPELTQFIRTHHIEVTVSRDLKIAARDLVAVPLGAVREIYSIVRRVTNIDAETACLSLEAYMLIDTENLPTPSCRFSKLPAV